MNEQLLHAILRLYALVAGSDGITNSEIGRIQQFLAPHTSDRSISRFIEKLEVWAQEAFQHQKEEGWVDGQLESIARTVNKELRLTLKCYLYLEILELTNADGRVSREEKKVLSRLPGLLHLDENDVQLLEKFATGTQRVDFNEPEFLLLDGFPKWDLNCRQLQIQRLEGFAVVLKLAQTEGFFVRVLENNETFLNGQWLQPGMSRMWGSGSTLRQEKADPVFFNSIQEKFTQASEKIPILFQANQVEFRFRDGKIGVQKISLAEKGGRLVAIMGASGCGKSTLFSVLNGNEFPTSGTVTINGIDVHRQSSRLEGIIGYIPQDDLLNERLTVFQNLYFAARFSFGHLQEAEIVSLCEKTLHSLNLSEVRNKEVGSPAKKSISGGQRKRLNIGLELIRQPSVLFVDEPTSGLSSSDSLRTMELLKNLALHGKLVFVIIHQPSTAIFQLFDRLIVMDKGGYTIYYGNPLEAIPYFRRESQLPVGQTAEELANSGEIFDLVEANLVNEMGHTVEVRKFSPKDWAKRFKENFSNPGVEDQPEPLPRKIFKPGFAGQVGLYFRRDVLGKLHDHQYLLINLLEAPVLAFLLALAVRFTVAGEWDTQAYRFSENENIPAYFFMSVIVALFMGLSVSAEEIIRDRLLLKREKFLHLSRDGYLLAKILLLFILSAFHTLAFVAISDTVLQVENMGTEFWLVLFSTSCFANMLGLLLSDSFKNAVVVYILIPLLLIPQLILGGTVVHYDKLNPAFGNPDRVPLVGDLMVSRWAYEALMVSQFQNSPFQEIIFDSEVIKSDAHYKRMYYLPNLQELNETLAAAQHPDSAKSPRLQGKRKILQTELIREGRHFGLKDAQWEYLNDFPVSPENCQKTHLLLEKFRLAYNKRYNEAERRQDDLIRKQGPGLANRKVESENKRIHEVLANSLDFQPKYSIGQEGIFRKVKPVYRIPEPKCRFDFRAHFYSPKKHWLGTFYPTEFFNVWVIWFFTFLTALALRFRFLIRTGNLVVRLVRFCQPLFHRLVPARG